MGLTACKRLIFTRGWTVGMATMIKISMKIRRHLQIKDEAMLV